MNKKLFYFLAVSFFLLTPLYAQEELDDNILYEKNTQEDNIPFEENTQEENTLFEESIPYMPYEESEKENAAYIESLGGKFSLRLSAYISNLKFYKDYDYTEKTYTANQPLEIGFGFLYGNFGLEFRQQTSFLYDSEYKKTQTQEGQFSYYARKAVFEIQIKDYKGFHSGSDNDIDLHLQFAGIFGQYIWNNEKFSWPAAFGLGERQLRSAGSFLLGGNIFYMMSENNLLESYKKKHILAIPNIGYAHTWVYKSNLFLTLSPSAGIGMAHEFSGTNHSAASLSFHGAVGYHWDDISFMISYNALIFSITLEDNSDSFVSTMLQCSVAKRF